MANCHRDPRKSAAFTPRNFMPLLDQDEEPATVEQAKRQLAAALTMSAKINDRRQQQLGKG